jgi:type II secretory pathway predicted ATPase ExeA
MDYLKFYELEREPFRNDPDGHFYFESAVHRRARMFLLRGAEQRKGLAVLVGESGCGKTTLARRIHEHLSDEKFAARMLLIAHAECARGWILPTVARSFGVKEPAKTAPDQLRQIQAVLARHAKAGRHPVLLIDEAQLLSNAEVMEEFRCLLNISGAGERTLSILLFGLPELNDILKLDAPLAQRVEIRADVRGLETEDVKAYVKHRLHCAEGSEDLFTPEALEALALLSGGVPRLINTLADNALFEGLMSEARPVDGSLVDAAAEQLELAPPIETAAASAAAASLETTTLAEAANAGPETEDPEPETVAGPSSGDSFSDFSMGSLVRDADAEDGDFESEAPTHADPKADALADLLDAAESAPAREMDDDLFEMSGESQDLLEALEAADAGGPDPEPLAAAGEADLLDDIEGEPPTEANSLAAFEVEIEPEEDVEIVDVSPEADDGGEDLLDAALATVEDPDDELPALLADTDANAEGDDFNLGELLEAATAEPAEPEVSEPELDSDDDEFDPGELLLDEEAEEVSALPIQLEAIEEPPADPEPTAGEDLDELFENIQVGE